MPGPSDIRVNPFNNATNYVNLTERHIVPSVSPFVVRLNEVPEKQDPSNMQMYYVDDTTGQTTETALTEVAATPGAGEFRPDYSTNAFDDTSWNTGLIEFSSADAGKIIEVSYTATGTLAGVKTNRYPAWWTDRGDGSDGAFNPSSNTTISGEKNYTSVFIPAGVTVTTDPFVLIKCSGAFLCNGNITVKRVPNTGGSGANGGGSSAVAGKNAPGASGGAGGWGGAGGSGGYIGDVNVGNVNALLYAAAYPITGAGGGGGGVGGGSSWNHGGAGGDGGGALYVVAKEIKLSGNIVANGADGGGKSDVVDAGGGGGGGGSVLLVADSIHRTGNINVSGGQGKDSGAAGNNGLLVSVELGVI